MKAGALEGLRKQTIIEKLSQGFFPLPPKS